MNASSRKSRHTRSAAFEALQPREMMAADIMRRAYITSYETSAELWAERILRNSEFKHSANNQPLGELKNFASEQEAQKFLTDGLLKIWQDVLGKPVDNKLNGLAYGYQFTDRGILRSAADSASLLTTPVVNSFNSTNNQVVSVDEADRFEVSGNGYVYAIGEGDNASNGQVVVVDARDPKNLRKVSTIDPKGFATKMHLVGDQLMLISSGFPLTHIQTYNVSDAGNPTLQTSLTISGEFQESRFAAGKLTLLGNQSLAIPRPLFIADDPTAVYSSLTDTPIGHFESAEEYAARIQPMVIGWMLLDMKMEGSAVEIAVGDWRDLVVGTNCDFGQQFTVLSFDLTESGLELIDSEALIGTLMNTSYVDDNTVYIASSLVPQSFDWGVREISVPQTEIFAIEFNSDTIEFVASGVIPGTIRDSRMMDEFQGNLRIFSDIRSWPNWFNSTASTDLYILKPIAGKLELIGQLNDVADGQALYSAFFDEDQAMITTWVSQIPTLGSLIPQDPLHGFDLSDPTRPVEMSELVIPGVSTYLQQVDATHLVGIGYIDAGSGDWRQQVSLYDVSDLTNLKVVDTWTSSQSGWPNFTGQFQNALGVHFNPESGLFSFDPSAFGRSQNPGLSVFKIDTGDQDPLRFLANVGAEGSIDLRSAIVGDTLFAISNVWLHTYSVDDLSVELDQELLANPGVSNWITVTENKSIQVNVLVDDYLTGGRVTSITSSKLGSEVTILEDGATILYQAHDIEGSGASEKLTYTVTLENGQTFTGTLFVSIYSPFQTNITDPVTSDPVTSDPVTSDPVTSAKAIEGDVNGDGEVSPHDVLLMVEHLNRQSQRIVAGEARIAMSANTLAMDMSGDREISPIDVLMLIERLNANAALRANGEAHEDSTSPLQVDDFHASDDGLISMLAANYADDSLRRSTNRFEIE